MAKNIVNLNVDGTVYTSRPFGTCSTAAATTAKEVSCADFALTSGATIIVKFTNKNSAASPTLNVNSTGAKNIYYRGAALTASSIYNWGAGDLVEFYYDGTQWNLLNVSNSDNNTYPSAYCATAAGTAAKTASCTNYTATANTYLHVLVVYANSSAGAITLNVNGKGAKPIYINGAASSSTNYALPAGSYIVYYDGTNYQFRTDGILPGKILKASDADTVNGKTVLSDVPANAKFTDTNTKVTSVGNHYEPESTSDDTLSIDASGATTSASWGSTNLVTGIDILRDAKGHVTGINVDSIKMPGNPNTTYSAGKGLTLSSTTFNVGAGNGIAVADDTVSANLRSATKLTNDSAAATETSGRIYPVALDKSGYLAVNVPWKNDDTKYGADRGITLVNSKYGHSNTAITAKTAFVDTDADASISVATNGGSFKVTDVTYDAYGHITGSQDRTITLSESKKGTVTSITLTQGDGITVSSSGTAITSSGTRTISLNAATSDTIGGIKVGYTTSGKNYKVQLDSNNNAYVNVPWTDNNTDTKNTAGTTEKLDTKLFLVGAASQGANPQTYSNTKVYIGSNNCLYSNGTKVSVEGHTHNYLSSLPSHTHSYTELTGSVADAADQAIVSSGTANGWKLYSLKSAAQKTATTSVSSSSTDSQVPTAKAVYTAITSGIKANDAMIFKGTLGTSGTITALPASHKIGDTYRVTTAGSYAGVQCEVGDLVICITAGTAANNAHWTVAQTNIDGAVTGPSSSTDGRVALFSGTSGKVLKQSSYTIGKSVPSDAKFTDTVYTHPSYTQVSSGLYKITTNSTGHITAATAVVKADITALGIPSTNTTYAVADHDTAGLIMPWRYHSSNATGPTAGSDTTAVTVNSISTTSNRYYAIEMDKSGRAFVNVPWTDNDTKYTLPLAANGTRGGIQIGYSESGVNVAVKLSSEKAYVALTKTAVTSALGYTPPTTNTTYSVADYDTAGLLMPLKSYSVACTFGTSAASTATAVTVNAISTTSNRYYAIEMDKNGRAFVNVPWTDSDTKYTLPAATSSALGGIKVGYTTSGKNYKVQLDSSNNAYVNVPWTNTTYSTKNMNVNGTNYAIYTSASSLPTVYGPTAAGTSGQILVSNGSGAPSWQDCGGKVKSTTAAVAIGTSWGTLLSATNLGTLCDSTVGTYAIQIYGPSSIGYSSGVFTWNSANSGDANEILLHRTGASTSIYLRLAANRTLQIAGSAAVSSSTITIKVKRLI